MRVTLLDLPFLRPALLSWDTNVNASWELKAERAVSLSDRIGVGGNFGALVAQARALLLTGQTELLASDARDRRFLRAVLTAWRDDPELARRTMKTDLLETIAPAGGCTRLTTVTAAGLLLEHFDNLDEWQAGLFRSMTSFVHHAAAAQEVRSTPGVIEALRAPRSFLLDPAGPSRLAEELAAVGSEPLLWFKQNHLGAYADGRFGRATRDAFYLEWIARADPESGDHSYLSRITEEAVARQRTETTGTDGRYFGHHVLEALTAKPTRHPSPTWLEALLAIGGDPRMRETPGWQRWWSRISGAGLARAQRWMQGINLTAFLDGVEAYARHTGNLDMQRMLERRRRFLIGLYEQDRIEDVRLILGDDIRMWIRRHVPAAAQDDVCRLRDSSKSDTAVIYVDCEDFALIEGSHVFRIHIFAGGPVPEVADRRVRVFDGSDLRDTFPEHFTRAHGDGRYAAFSHDVGGAWLMKTLDFLRAQRVHLDEPALMERNDYAALERRRAGWR
ncbi:EH signature domain-containing protein [Cellulomonas wangsupingiae]|uniref:EH signature domain-containing protein n=1 Tax=Cellulomonas wangsupingiae TaxID=2968085 RepID=UPI001D0F3EB7|nr:EH signature domain-containing protein [Cellulomonas wangsupingiae]MCM0639531.1 EH signature domain-containing protein [Cellulomonas wangsupingiae]